MICRCKEIEKVQFWSSLKKLDSRIIDLKMRLSRPLRN